MHHQPSLEISPHNPEHFMTIPAKWEQPHAAYKEYLRIHPLVPAHELKGDTLVALHHSLRKERVDENGRVVRASHLLAGAWAQVELAHVRDSEGAHMEAQELIALAANQADTCEILIATEYEDHRDYLDRLYRTRLLQIYAEHYRQIGPVYWPEQTTPFQRTAYDIVQYNLVDPLLSDYRWHLQSRDESGKKDFSIIKGMLAETVVLQCLNRLQREQEFNEWTAVPASMRENCRLSKERDASRLSSAYDVKCLFRDQSFVPIEVKWNVGTGDKSYNPAVARMYVNGKGVSALATAIAMSKEVAGEPLCYEEAHQISLMTSAVLESIGSVSAQGNYKRKRPRSFRVSNGRSAGA